MQYRYAEIEMQIEIKRKRDNNLRQYISPSLLCGSSYPYEISVC